MITDTPMNNKCDYFHELGIADIYELTQKVKAITPEVWKEQNAIKINQFFVLNTTKHILFRFIPDFNHLYDYTDWSLWNEYEDLLMPIMIQAAEALGYTDYAFPRVMLAKLPAAESIGLHEDKAASHYIHKIHVPLVTNPKVQFIVGNQTTHIERGHIVEVNNKRRHGGFNGGEEDRIHLIFECYSMADLGKVGK